MLAGPSRPYRHIKDMKLETMLQFFLMLTYPMALKAISKFENANNVSVNVYSIDDEQEQKSPKDEPRRSNAPKQKAHFGTKTK